MNRHTVCFILSQKIGFTQKKPKIKGNAPLKGDRGEGGGGAGVPLFEKFRKAPYRKLKHSGSIRCFDFTKLKSSKVISSY